jgi:hypothetical protein
MVGMEATAKFLENAEGNARLRAALGIIRGSTPFFEVFLSTENIDGLPRNTQIVSARVITPGSAFSKR